MSTESQINSLVQTDKEITDNLKKIIENKQNENPQDPEPVNPKDYIDKTILFEIKFSGTNDLPHISEGIIRKVSNNGFLKIDEITYNAGRSSVNTRWHNPHNVYILDVLSDE